MARDREIVVIEEYGDEKEELVCRGCQENDVLVQNRELREVIADIKAVMREKGLVSLSAPAIGSDLRVFCIKIDGDIKTYINPCITHAEGLQLSRERCVCLPGKEFLLLRNNKITVNYMKITGVAEEKTFLGMLAFVFQHELHHLDGPLISDIGEEIPEGFDSFSEEEKEQFISDFLDTLDMRNQAIQQEIEETPELKQLSDGIKFMEGVIKGEIKLVPAPEAQVPESGE